MRDDCSKLSEKSDIYKSDLGVSESDYRSKDTGYEFNSFSTGKTSLSNSNKTNSDHKLLKSDRSSNLSLASKAPSEIVDKRKEIKDLEHSEVKHS